jgi:protein O-GlcNAc transferase
MSKTGRNDPCPCGSGKKFKHCCVQLGAAPAASRHVQAKPVPAAIAVAQEHLNAGRLPQAEAFYRQILDVEPDHPDALHSLGVIAYQVGNNDVAAELIGRAAHISPSGVKYSNLGLVLQAQGKPDAAVASYRKALLYQPDHAVAHNNLGNALADLGNLDESIAHYRRALLLKPDFAVAHNNLGFTLSKLGRLDEAIECYRRALGLKPDFAEAYSNLLFLYSFHTSLDPSEYLSLARGWEVASVPAQDRQRAREKNYRRAPLAGRRLKVGYVSGDYRQHVVSNFIEQLFVHHDRARMDLFAYSNTGMRDAVTARLQALADHWVSVVGMPDADVLERIESDKIDVLIDLSGHTMHDRLSVFARRAAPVQASYLGYFASTGLTEMDYWIGDEILTPTETDSHFCETIWRLPRAWLAYRTLDDAPRPDWQPARDGTLWVGSFNNLGKLTLQTLALWAKVLNALPEGKLLLKTKELADAGNRQRILDAMAAHGIAPNRIELQRDSGWADYMAAYNCLDIALDPVGAHGGGTTTCDALWMGVPIIHALGDRATSRFAASMLNAIGHPEWIVHSETEYIEKVVSLACNVELRKTLRSNQRERMASSPLCDAKDLATSLENAYFGMFERWQEGQGSQSSRSVGMP